jgi:hypothetical protein
MPMVRGVIYTRVSRDPTGLGGCGGSKAGKGMAASFGMVSMSETGNVSVCAGSAGKLNNGLMLTASY